VPDSAPSPCEHIRRVAMVRMNHRFRTSRNNATGGTMSAPEIPQPGTVRWVDRTVENAVEIRDFYSAVAGWRPEPVPTGRLQRFSHASPFV